MKPEIQLAISWKPCCPAVLYVFAIENSAHSEFSHLYANLAHCEYTLWLLWSTGHFRTFYSVLGFVCSSLVLCPVLAVLAVLLLLKTCIARAKRLWTCEFDQPPLKGSDSRTGNKLLSTWGVEPPRPETFAQHWCWFQQTPFWACILYGEEHDAFLHHECGKHSAWCLWLQNSMGWNTKDRAPRPSLQTPFASPWQSQEQG